MGKGQTYLDKQAEMLNAFLIAIENAGGRGVDTLRTSKPPPPDVCILTRFRQLRNRLLAAISGCFWGRRGIAYRSIVGRELVRLAVLHSGDQSGNQPLLIHGGGSSVLLVALHADRAEGLEARGDPLI